MKKFVHLGADVLSTKIISKEAKNALDSYRKTVNNEEEIKQIDIFKRHLDNVLGEGLYGGKILSKAEIDDWAKLLKTKFGTALEKVDSFDHPRVLTQFDANANTIRYKDEVTEYFIAHESFHAEEMHLIGFEEYAKDCRLRGVKAENYTAENWQRLYKREKVCI